MGQVTSICCIANVLADKRIVIRDDSRYIHANQSGCSARRCKSVIYSGTARGGPPADNERGRTGVTTGAVYPDRSVASGAGVIKLIVDLVAGLHGDRPRIGNRVALRVGEGQRVADLEVAPQQLHCM